MSAADRVALCALLVAICAASPARAEDAISAERLFERGRELWRDGRFEEACAKFEASMALDAAAGTQIKIARCREREGKLAAAWYAYQRARVLARTLSDLTPERRRALDEGIAKELDALHPRLPWLLVRAPRAPAGLVVARAGVRLPPGSFGEWLPVDPGVVVVHAEAPNHAAFDRSVTLVAGQRVVIDVGLVPLADPAEGARASRRTAGVLTAGAGLTSLAISAVLGAHVAREVTASNGFCTPANLCEPQGIALRADARHLQTAAIGAAIGGGVALGGGVLTYLLSRR